MGVTKTELFTDVQNELAVIGKSLAHPARIAILQHLIKVDACINGDLVQELGLAQPTISQHLRELKAVGLIQGTVEGPRVSYCIDPTRWIAVKQMINRLFDQIGDPCQDDCC